MAGVRYEHKPLAPGFIRVISILEPRDNGDSAISLQEVLLEEAERTYTAISYTWGSPDIVHKVWIDGTNEYLLVRDNIWRFFRHCFSTGFRAPERLWIDSVSINQEDNDEKSIQVALMGDIFGKAEKVLVWLDKASKVSLNTSWASTNRRQYLDTRAAFSVLKKLKRIVEPWIKYRLLLAWREEVSRILLHPYWRRLWIVQEIWQGRIVSVILGLRTADLCYIRALDLAFGSKEYWTPQLTLHDTSYYSFCEMDFEKFKFPISAQEQFPRPIINDIRHLQEGRGWNTFENLLERFGQQLCQDKRDLLYGLVGMTDFSNRVTPNYTFTVEEVYLQALLLMLEEDLQNLIKMDRILSFDRIIALAKAMAVDIRSVRQTLTTLPSARARKLTDRTLRIDLVNKLSSIWYLRYTQIFNHQSIYDEVTQGHMPRTRYDAAGYFGDRVRERLSLQICPDLFVICDPYTSFVRTLSIRHAIRVNEKTGLYWEVEFPVSLLESIEGALHEAHSVCPNKNPTRLLCNVILSLSILDIFQILDILQSTPRDNRKVHSVPKETWKWNPWEFNYWTRGLGRVMTRSVGGIA